MTKLVGASENVAVIIAVCPIFNAAAELVIVTVGGVVSPPPLDDEPPPPDEPPVPDEPLVLTGSGSDDPLLMPASAAAPVNVFSKASNDAAAVALVGSMVFAMSCNLLAAPV